MAYGEQILNELDIRCCLFLKHLFLRSDLQGIVCFTVKIFCACY
jgi:hypothetical protein